MPLPKTAVLAAAPMLLLAVGCQPTLDKKSAMMLESTHKAAMDAKSAATAAAASADRAAAAADQAAAGAAASAKASEAAAAAADRAASEARMSADKADRMFQRSMRKSK